MRKGLRKALFNYPVPVVDEAVPKDELRAILVAAEVFDCSMCDFSLFDALWSVGRVRLFLRRHRNYQILKILIIIEKYIY